MLLRIEPLNSPATSSEVAGLVCIKSEKFILSSQATKKITLGTGLLVVIASGSQYGAVFLIDYWTNNVNKISDAWGDLITGGFNLITINIIK